MPRDRWGLSRVVAAGELVAMLARQSGFSTQADRAAIRATDGDDGTSPVLKTPGRVDSVDLFYCNASTIRVWFRMVRHTPIR